MCIEDYNTYQCVVSYPIIAERFGISVNTVAKYVGQLEEHGLIRIEHTDIFTKGGQNAMAVSGTLPCVSPRVPLCAIFPLTTGLSPARPLTAKCGSLRETKGKQEKALALSKRQGRHFCPQCGQLRGQKLTLLWRREKLIDAVICENFLKRHS